MTALANLPGGAVRGALVDIDGTLLLDDRAIPGAAGALARLAAGGIAVRLLTNTSRRDRTAIAAALAAAGIAAPPTSILTPAVLARRLILASTRPRAALFVADEARADFDGVEDDRGSPGHVVLGDLGAAFTYAALNQAFRLVRAGARLVALHRQPWWRPPGGEDVLDVGAFVAALEYACGTEAILIGKPAPEFFRLALGELGLAARDVVMIGDDPVSDAAGAAAAGLRSILVRTGRGGSGRADLVIDSLADLV
jgi:HAD superfamily hydrolase (TIGR01458 family)